LEFGAALGGLEDDLGALDQAGGGGLLALEPLEGVALFGGEDDAYFFS
jgi:hypothetical protein